MMNIKNHVQLIGRLGANPEVKVLTNGTKRVKFSIAVSQTYKSKTGEKVTDVQWHSIIAWGNLASIAERILHKGSQVTVDGKLVKRVYITKEGNKLNNTEVLANQLMVLEKKAA